MKITIPRKILNRFRKECRGAYPKETFAALQGTRNDEGIEITSIVPVPHEGTEDAIFMEPHQIPRAKIRALKNGSEFVGTIHSHPSTPNSPSCEHPSPLDVKMALRDGMAIAAVVSVTHGGHRSEVYWFVPQAPPKVSLL